MAREVYSGTETIRADFAVGWGAALDQVMYAGDAVASNYNTSNLMSRFSVVSAAQQLWKAITLIGDGITQFLRSFHTRLYTDETIHTFVKEAKEGYVRKIYQERTGDHLPLTLADKHPYYYSRRPDDLLDCKDEIWNALKINGEWQESEPPSQEEFDEAQSAAEIFDRLVHKESRFKPKSAYSVEKEVTARLSPIAAKRLQQDNYDAEESAKHMHWVEHLLTSETIPMKFQATRGRQI